MTSPRTFVPACAASAPRLPERVVIERRARDQGRHVGRMDRAAHRHPAALYGGRGRDDFDAGDPGGARPRCAARARRPPTSISSSSRHRPPTTPFPRSRPRCRPILASSRAPLSICRRSAPASSTRSRRRTSSCVSGSHKRALVIGAETFSRLLDWSDRTTCVLFGDGAGAIVLEARAERRPARPRPA